MAHRHVQISFLALFSSRPFLHRCQVSLRPTHAVGWPSKAAAAQKHGLPFKDHTLHSRLPLLSTRQKVQSFSRQLGGWKLSRLQTKHANTEGVIWLLYISYYLYIDVCTINENVFKQLIFSQSHKSCAFKAALSSNHCLDMNRMH